MSGIVIDGAAVQIIIPWAAAGGFLIWLFLEVRKDYHKTKEAVKELDKRKLDAAECLRRMNEEKEGRIREREAVRADRELRGDS